ncbi:MAG: glycine cleavage system protein GcvH [Bdellovibrionia bacterium]
MRFPENLKYTKDHEWAKLEGSQMTVGITDHAQSALGDVVYVELPPVGKELKKGEPFGVVESIKAVSDLYAPVSGKVVQTNQALLDDPAQINSDPYEAAWMVKLEVTDPSATSELMDSQRYTQFVSQQK